MKTVFKYLAFIQTNTIDINSLPNDLQNRIRGIEDWVTQLEHTIGEDRRQLEIKIERLDLELEEDLYEYYDDILCNNDICEIPEKGIIKEVKKKIKTKNKVRKKQKPIIELKPAPIVSKLSKNEQILKTLHETGKTNSLNRSFLLKLGMSGTLDQKIIVFGDYRLVRTSFFTYSYRLDKI